MALICMLSLTGHAVVTGNGCELMACLLMIVSSRTFSMTDARKLGLPPVDWLHYGLAASNVLAAAALSALFAASGAYAQKGETVKIAWIDPLSGLMAPVGQNQVKSFQFFAEKFNANNPAGVKFEVIAIDNKLSPAESLNALKSAIDQGVRYVTQGNGSGAALAIIDAVNKHNERNPGKEVIYLNHSAVDPDLTNSKCSYWHFRFDADTSMKMEAITTFLKDQPDVKKVYLLNQNYAHGHQVAKYAKEGLAKKRPDVQIVGEGNDRDVMVKCNWVGTYDSSTGGTLKITRNIA